MPLVNKKEGESSLIGAYAYGAAMVALAIGSIWFYKFWSNMYDRVFPNQKQ